MWGTPKTTLGGAGMWECKRSNGVVQLQRYKLEGTALEGLFNSLRSVYSDAPNYRIIAVNQPYWEFANGHTQEGMETLMDWIDNNAIAKLTQFNIGNYNTGDDDVKIRIFTDFMQSFVQIFGTLHKLPISDQEFVSVVKRMSEVPNLGNSQYQVAIVQKQPVAPVVPAPQVVQAVPVAHPVTKVSIPTAVAPVPFSGSQLVTKYERDPMTGQVRQIQVYQPAYTGYPGNYPPVGYQKVVYLPPGSAAPHQPIAAGHAVQYASPAVGKPPSNVMVYQHSRSNSGSSQQQAPTSYQPPVANPYAPPNPYGQHSYPPPGHQRVSSAPRSHSPTPVIPAPYSASSSTHPSMNAPIPVSQWDAPQKQYVAPGVLAPVEPAQPKQAQQMPAIPQGNPFSFEQDAAAANVAPGSDNPFILPPVPAPSSASRPANPTSDASIDSKPVSSATPTDADEDKNLCKICFERDLDCAFLPCSHVACYHCATTLKLTTCPFCRAEISQVLKLYRA